MAVAARRALWYSGVSPKARHMNSGRGRGLDISEPNGPLDSYIRKLMDAGNLEEINRIGKILSKRDMVKQSSESLIFKRKKKMGTHNMQDMWKGACMERRKRMEFYKTRRGLDLKSSKRV
ncbi:uncharacterized protein [Oryza sativa Japonica Group]|uniref:uncharacterized protein isoform X2 n=1 Tax=Oryza sativa subsp. japonica TaxID=39947 RepID=UPI00339C6D9D